MRRLAKRLQHHGQLRVGDRLPRYPRRQGGPGGPLQGIEVAAQQQGPVLRSPVLVHVLGQRLTCPDIKCLPVRRQRLTDATARQEPACGVDALQEALGVDSTA